MKYYSIDNIVLIAYSEEFNYIATLMPSIGILKSGASDANILLLELTTSSNEIDPKTFQEFIAKPVNSIDAGEIAIYWKTVENTKS